MNKGICIIALGHHYYGKMAAGLASTIRLCSNLPIALICDRAALMDVSEKEKQLFTIIPMLNGGYPLRTKIKLFELSPFDETLYLDADMAWFDKDPIEIFNQCETIDFAMKNYGATPLEKAENNDRAWAKFNEIALIYNLKTELNYHLSSEVIYFKKTERVKKLFDAALEIFDKPKISFRTFAGYMPDELAFSIAMMQTGIYPAFDNWEPVFWRQTNTTQIEAIRSSNKFYGISMGGMRATDKEQAIYNNIVSSAYFRLGIPVPHKWVNKNRFLNERKKI